MKKYYICKSFRNGELENDEMIFYANDGEKHIANLIKEYARGKVIKEYTDLREITKEEYSRINKIHKENR